MNYPTEKQPPGNEPESPREKIERAMASAIMEVIQLRRVLWLLVKQSGPTVTVDETEAHPLWRMNATRLPDGKLQLEATQLKDPTDVQLATLAEILEGSKSQLGDVMQQTELRDHPPAYIEKCLRGIDLARAPDGTWTDIGMKGRN